MMYSCAVFESPDAHARDRVARQARPARAASSSSRPDDRVLEIGTGWGGFALHAARAATAATSPRRRSRAEQYEFARGACATPGLDHRVTVLDADYRDLDDTFDKVVAIEMIEAVDWREYDTFFAQCRRLLDRRRARSSCRRSSSPTRASTARSAAPTSSRPRSSRAAASRRSAALTAAATGRRRSTSSSRTSTTSARTTARRCAAGGPTSTRPATSSPRSGYDERFVRLWDFYFSYCEAGFDERYVSDVQLVYVRPTAPCCTCTAASHAARTLVNA